MRFRIVLAVLVFVVGACGGGDGGNGDPAPVEDEPDEETTTTTEPANLGFELHVGRGGTCDTYDTVPAGMFVFEHCDTTVRVFRVDETPARTLGEYSAFDHITRPGPDGTVHTLTVIEEIEGGIATDRINLKVAVVTFDATSSRANQPEPVVIDIPDTEDDDFRLGTVHQLDDTRLVLHSRNWEAHVLINVADETATWVNVPEDDVPFARFADRTVTIASTRERSVAFVTAVDTVDDLPELEPVQFPEGWELFNERTWTGPVVFNDGIIVANDTNVGLLAPDGTVKPFPAGHPLTIVPKNSNVTGQTSLNGTVFYAFNSLSGDLEVWNRDQRTAVVTGAPTAAADNTPPEPGTLAALGEWTFLRTEPGFVVLDFADHGEVPLATDGTFYTPDAPCAAGNLEERRFTATADQAWFIDDCEPLLRWTALDRNNPHASPDLELPS